MGQLRREMADLNRSKLPYGVIDATREELMALYERHSGRRVGLLEYIELLDFSCLHEVLAPFRKELGRFAEYYRKNLPKMLSG